MKINLENHINIKKIIRNIVFLFIFFIAMSVLTYTIIKSIGKEKTNTFNMILIPENIFEVIAIKLLNPLVEKYIYKQMNMNSFYDYYLDSRFKKNLFSLNFLQNNTAGKINCGDFIDMTYSVYHKKNSMINVVYEGQYKFVLGQSIYPIFNIVLDGKSVDSMLTTSIIKDYYPVMLTNKFFEDHAISSQDLPLLYIDIRINEVNPNNNYIDVNNIYFFSDQGENENMALLCGDFIEEMEYEIYDSRWNIFDKGIMKGLYIGDLNIPTIFSLGAKDLQVGIERNITTDSKYLIRNILGEKANYSVGKDITEGMIFVKLKVLDYKDQNLS